MSRSEPSADRVNGFSTSVGMPAEMHRAAVCSCCSGALATITIFVCIESKDREFDKIFTGLLKLFSRSQDRFNV